MQKSWYFLLFLFYSLQNLFSSAVEKELSSWGKYCKFGKHLNSSKTYGDDFKASFTEPDIPFNISKTSGLSLCTIHQKSGRVSFYKEFPLNETYAVWKDLERYMLNFSPQRIIVLHLQGKSIYGLRNTTDLLASFGSVFVEHLDPFSSWTWVFVYKGKTLYERVTYYYPNKKIHSGSLSHAYFLLSPLDPKYFLPKTQAEFERWKFCENYGVMGDLCDESQPATLDYSHLEKFENPLLKSIPVIITAGSRTSYLYQSLKSYLRAWGVVKRNIHVLLGSNSSQTIDLLNLLNFNFTYLQPSLYGKEYFFPFLFYKEVYKFAYENFKSSFVIFLEEDVEVSLDFFSYISQTMYLLEKDPTLYCVTGHSTTGLKYTSFNEYSLLRGNVQVGWGYIVTKNFIKEVLEVWPSTYISDTLVYDGWLYYYVIGERECIFPEVSRSLHFGVGLNTVYWLTEASFFSTPLHNATKRIEFTNLEKFMINRWTTDLRNKIIKSIPIKESPCRENFISTLHPGSYVMFYNHTQNDETTYYNHAFISSCFRAWMFSNQGQHHSVKTIQATPNITFYLVAVPESSFSDLKPPDYIPIDIRSQSFEDRNEYIRVYNIMTNLLYIKLRNVTRDFIYEKLFQ